MNRPRLGFRDKIAVLVALPLVAVVLAGVPLLASRLEVVRESAALRDTARTAAAVQPVLADLAAERVLGLAAVAVPVDARDGLLARYAATRDRVAAAARSLDGTAPPGLDAALAGLGALDAVRAEVVGRTATAGRVAAGYDGAIAALLDAAALDGTDPAGVPALVRAGERADAAGSALVRAVVEPPRAVEAAVAATDATAAATLLRRDVERSAPDAAAAVDAVLGGPSEARVTELGNALRADPRGFAGSRAGTVPGLVADVTAAAGARGLVESQVLAVAASAAATSADQARWGALTLGLVLVLLAAGVVAVGLQNGRSVSRPLRKLAGAADQVAELARTELMRVADSDDDDIASPAPKLAAVNIQASDELGELAGAFNRVQAVAALLLERQTLVRQNSAAMLGNVGRRTRTLVARQLDLIDSLEQSEQDPERLERLYRLDHLTSRLRRNADSLLVLSSARDDEFGGEPQPVVTVVRAALASIEGYRQVSLGEMPDFRVQAAVHADVTLLVAELLENAAAFSPPTAPVTVDVNPHGGGCRIEIVDHGVGLAVEEMARHNEGFVSRERLEVAPTDVLGLVVVGRIARRHGITVQLRPTPGTGVTATVDLPARLLVPARVPGGTNGAARPVPDPRPQPTAQSAPQPTSRQVLHQPPPALSPLSPQSLSPQSLSPQSFSPQSLSLPLPRSQPQPQSHAQPQSRAQPQSEPQTPGDRRGSLAEEWFGAPSRSAAPSPGPATPGQPYPALGSPPSIGQPPSSGSPPSLGSPPSFGQPPSFGSPPSPGSPPGLGSQSFGSPPVPGAARSPSGPHGRPVTNGARPLRRRVAAPPEQGDGRHSLVAAPGDDAAARAMAAELDRAVSAPPGAGAALANPGGRPRPDGRPPQGGPEGRPHEDGPAPGPPPGAGGLRRRVRGASFPLDEPAAPLLGAPTDADAARDLVHDLESGIERATAHLSAEAVRPRTTEEDR